MTLEMTHYEARELLGVLDSATEELLREVHHADNREFRRLLSARYDDLNSVRERLSRQLESEGIPSERSTEHISL